MIILVGGGDGFLINGNGCMSNGWCISFTNYRYRTMNLNVIQMGGFD